MKILLLGKNGQLGHALCHSLSQHGEVLTCGRAECDLQDFSGLSIQLANWQPNLIVNAAAYTAVDQAQTDSHSAYTINRDAVAALARYAAQARIRLIHYSTDYVFDGYQTTPYHETDSPHPLSVYGASKLAGEQAIQASGCDYLIFRTSWVASAVGSNFVKTILRLASQRSELKIVADQIGAPTSTRLLTAITEQAIQTRLAGGIYHLSCAGSTSWHGYAEYLVTTALSLGMPLRLSPKNIVPIATEDYPLPATRPKNSRLDCRKLQHTLGVALPDWQTEIALIVAQLAGDKAQV